MRRLRRRITWGLFKCEIVSPTICLATRPEKKEWVRKVDIACLVINLLACFGAFLGRVINNFEIFKYSLFIVGFFVFVQVSLAMLSYVKGANLYYPRNVEIIGFNEQSLLIGMQMIPMSKLKSIVFNADGYSGQEKIGRGGPHSGNGAVTFVLLYPTKLGA